MAAVAVAGLKLGIGHDGKRRQRRVRRAGGSVNCAQLNVARVGRRGAAVRIESEARVAGILAEQEEEAGLVVGLDGRADGLRRSHACETRRRARPRRCVRETRAAAASRHRPPATATRSRSTPRARWRSSSTDTGAPARRARAAPSTRRRSRGCPTALSGVHVETWSMSSPSSVRPQKRRNAVARRSDGQPAPQQLVVQLLVGADEERLDERRVRLDQRHALGGNRARAPGASARESARPAARSSAARSAA